MLNNKVIGDPLFQLNLVLFVSLPGPPDGSVNPALYNAGYRIDSISPQINIPLPVIKAVKGQGIQINSAVKPEVLLKHKDINEYILVECKRSSFSSTSTTSYQANAYLVLSGNILRESLGKPVTDEWQSKLLYFVKDGDEHLLSECLRELTNALQEIACSTNEYNVCGIGQEDTGVYLNLKYVSNLDLTDSEGNVNILLCSSNYRPLYLIPYDIGISHPDEYTKSVIKERIRSSLAALIVRSLGPNSFEINVDNLLRKIIKLWDVWDDNESKKHIRKITKNYILQIAKQLNERYDLGIVQKQNSFEIGDVSNDLKLRLISYFKSNAYRKGRFDFAPEEIDQIEFDI